MRCEFCGGRLRPVWGLAQLAQRARTARGGSSVPLQEGQVRETLDGRSGQSADDQSNSSRTHASEQTGSPRPQVSARSDRAGSAGP